MSNYCERFEMHPKTLLSHYSNMTIATESTSVQFLQQRKILEMLQSTVLPMHMGSGGIHVPSHKVSPRWRYMNSYKVLMLYL